MPHPSTFSPSRCFKCPTFLLLALCTATASQAQAPWQNVLVGANNAEEPSIAINPKNPQQLAAGANIDNWYLSSNGGRNWRRGNLSSTFGVWGDPCLMTDTAGTFYYFHLAQNQAQGFPDWVDRIVCQRLDNFTTAQWNAGSATGFRGAPHVQDKEWVTADPRTNALYVTWTDFDAYGSAAATDSSHINFSRSLDRGVTWSPPVSLSRRGGTALDDGTTVEGAVPACGPNGELYVVWAGPQGLAFNKSLDGGTTWLPHEAVIGTFPQGWAFPILGLGRANGMPVTVCDRSPGPHRGTLYVNWSDKRSGPGDTDVWLMKSTDGGQTWSAPLRVNDDAPGHEQFLNWMTIDQTTGYLYGVFYDRRHYQPGADSTDVYLAVSTDGGSTFRNQRISQQPFVPDSTVFFGDYSNITAHAGVVRPIWARMDGQQTSVWTALLDGQVLGAPALLPNAALTLNVWPNPTATRALVEVPEPGELLLLDDLGRRVRSTHVAATASPTPLEVRGLPPGVYIVSFRGRTRVGQQRLIIGDEATAEAAFELD